MHQAHPTPLPNWFDEGICFECTRCGTCCMGGPGAVFLSEADIERFCRGLGLEREAFLSRFTHRVDGEISLIEQTNHDCIFLQNAQCQVHELRPVQCRTYPFWFERMRSEDAWGRTELECPGIGRGRRWSRDEILDQLDRDFYRPQLKK